MSNISPRAPIVAWFLIVAGIALNMGFDVGKEQVRKAADESCERTCFDLEYDSYTVEKNGACDCEDFEDTLDS